MSGLEPTAGQWLMGALPAAAFLAGVAGVSLLVTYLRRIRSFFGGQDISRLPAGHRQDN